ncbi:hypothetical protein DPSP01_000633 [Paraphaeosphaeria sporulosa]|uniref:Transcriptional co-activator n=1 Tax=Paraphaeosphaeria sporulosa TaxID=1460663 RepID=A0A177C8N1_9PLEO|nr:uncharacterized protein CC84DRAFT_865848 [Paraphaeosphaeria sporulosa]OAG03756.1 hypothetical protein CC84DRAFT_865848 [Paraphaeosphaeria sporulosa]
MAGTIRPNDMDMSTTPIMSSKTLPDLSIPLKSASKPSTPRAPRIDVEPLYTAVKSALGDADWTTYKTSLSAFLLGNLNQEELTARLDAIFARAEAEAAKTLGPRGALERAHNALVMGVYANVWRDAPEAGIASWVSSSDKVSGSVPKGTGDESEKRLKQEVMQISRRERKRLKTIHQGASGGFDFMPLDPVGGMMMEYHEARRVKLPEAGPAAQAGGYGKTNWDLEIRKRYTAPLFTETHEFPTASSISLRLLPICYESGLPQGHAPDCADLLNIACENYIKEALTNFFTLVNANGTGYVRTAEYKKRVEREEARVARGEMVRLAGGELPVEHEERRKRKLLCMEDLRLALEIGDSYLAHVPILAGAISHSRCLDTPGVEDIYLPPRGKAMANGFNGTKPNPHALNLDRDRTRDVGDPMDIDEESNWQGGSVKDIDDLDSALDAVLELGDL